MTLTRPEKIALEEYVAAAEELYAHLTVGDRQNPPRLQFLVRQLGGARPGMIKALCSGPLPHVG